MTRQNRVLPTGEIVATPARGLFMGNRGILHDTEGRLGVSRWKHTAWICCALSFKGRRRPVMAPGRYTELFFLDEAVALAAGHRPCAECRRNDYSRFRAAWAAAFGTPPQRAAEMDNRLHGDRVGRDRRQIRHDAEFAALPAGAFVLWNDAPHLVTRTALQPFSASGYGAPLPRPRYGAATVLTPRRTCACLMAGYTPALHPTAAV
ncbi:hypothetical protein [Tropicimonas marinistellae]|uniref:hypothetical protein n=1 Tax=Tropicimonas marinistellae TaxID=1739787 RepID=UPI000835FF08|nr:hypothetical protein [Tropicimonas marinistellae]